MNKKTINDHHIDFFVFKLLNRKYLCTYFIHYTNNGVFKGT